MIILQLVWLMLPAGVANMVPPFAAMLMPKFNTPLDLGKEIGGIRIFGPHKTIRGIISGTLASLFVFWLQKNLYGSIPESWYLTDYRQISVVFGAWMGIGALAGDAIKSFFKRRSGVASGKSWFPWDQIDWVVGLIVPALVYVSLNVYQMVLLIGIGLGLHLIIKAIGFAVKINDSII